MTAWTRTTLAAALSAAALSIGVVGAGNDNPLESYERHLIGFTAITTERLHRIKIGEVESLERSLEQHLAQDAKAMYRILGRDDTTPRDAQRIYDTLRLLAVMNEKFEIEHWRNDAELMDIFLKAQTNDLEHTEKLRCNNWRKPMWVGTDDCT